MATSNELKLGVCECRWKGLNVLDWQREGVCLCCKKEIDQKWVYSSVLFLICVNCETVCVTVQRVCVNTRRGEAVCVWVKATGVQTSIIKHSMYRTPVCVFSVNSWCQCVCSGVYQDAPCSTYCSASTWRPTQHYWTHTGHCALLWIPTVAHLLRCTKYWYPIHCAHHKVHHLERWIHWCFLCSSVSCWAFIMSLQIKSLQA